jgi:tetratricopeptide (TPR) repeat protein
MLERQIRRRGAHMLFKLRNLALLAGLFLLTAASGMAQVCAVEGTVTGLDGQPLQGAIVDFQRQDIKGSYKVKTDKKGHYGHYGLPIGTYNEVLLVDGKEVDHINNLHTRTGDPQIENFDMKKAQDQSKALSAAMKTGTLSKEQERGMSADQKAAIEKANKENEARLAKNKALNDAYNAGKTALEAKNYDEAITNFNKAAEMDSTQAVIFSQMATAYEGAAVAKPTDAADLRAKEVDSWKKAIGIDANNAGYYNNMALAYGKMKDIPDAQTNIDKAAQLDPPGAGKYYFNLGALLTNSGQTDGACTAFKKALDADATYADAHYQYGICLVSKAQVNPTTGKVIPPPGTIEAFQKYLELKPDGPNAEAAKAMLASLEGSVATKYVDPNAKKKK